MNLSLPAQFRHWLGCYWMKCSQHNAICTHAYVMSHTATAETWTKNTTELLTPLHCTELGWGSNWCKWTSSGSGCGCNSPQVSGVWLQSGEVASKWLGWVKSWVLHCNCLIPDNSTVHVWQLNNIGYDDAIPPCFWGNAPANYCPVCSNLLHYTHYRWGRWSCKLSEKTQINSR